MKKLRYLLYLFTVLMSFNFNVYAEEYSKTISGDGTACINGSCGQYSHTMIVNTNDLENLERINVHSPSYDSIYVDDEYQLCFEKFYGFDLYDNDSKIITELNGEIEILVKETGLNKGDKYNVYYLNTTHPRVLNKEKIGDIAEVVEIEGELYIKLTADIISAFGLEKDVSDAYKNEWEKISENDLYIFPGIKPTKTVEDGFDFMTYFSYFANRNLPYSISPANEFAIEDEFHYMTLKFNSIPGEKHIVKYKWQENEIPKKYKKELDEIEKGIKDSTVGLDNIHQGMTGVYFEIEDLNYINYLYNNSNGNNEGAISYSSDLRKIFKYNNFKYYFEYKMGGIQKFNNYMIGDMLIEKNGLMYTFLFAVGTVIKPVIYIPDNTLNTDDAYIEAALLRIKNSLGIEDVTLEIAGKRNDLNTTFTKFYNEEKLSENYYLLKLGENSYEFLIEKNSQKAKELEFKTKDLDTNVEINTNSGKIPHDTSIEVEFIGKDHKKYNDIIKYLSTEFADIYDLKLFSESKNQYIKKLPNGKFKVKIPVKDKYKDKELIIYYIDDNGKKEEYKVTREGNFAVFETDHFSTYSLVAKDINNPNTSDNILISIIICILSLSGIITLFIKRYN